MALTKVTEDIRTLGTGEVLDANIATDTISIGKISGSAAGAAGTFLKQDGTWATAGTVTDTTGIESDIALLGFKVAVAGTMAKYNLVDQTEDAFMDPTGIDALASTNETRNAANYYSGNSTTVSTFDESNSDPATNQTGTIQSYTVPAGVITLTVEVWGARGGSGYNSWKQATTTAALSGGGNVQYKGGFAARMKGQFTGLSGGEDVKILVGQPGLGAELSTSVGQSSGGGASWVMLDLGAASTAGTTNGAGNGTRYTPLVVAGGGGGAACYNGYIYGQSETPWTRRGEADASATTTGSANSGTYAFVAAVNGAGGVYSTAGGAVMYAAGGGGGFLTNGLTTTQPHVPASTGTGGQSFLNGGAGTAVSTYGATNYGTWNSGYGGAGAGNIGGSGGGGGYSGGGGGSGSWPSATMNGGGGGSIINTDYSGTTLTATGGVTDKQTSARGEFGQVIITNLVHANMTLVSNATTAETTPTKGDIVMTYTNGLGTALVGTDLKAYASRDGTTWTAMTLVAQGNTGTASPHFIVAAHDVDISGQPSGTSMKYKIETLNQSAAKETRIQAVSLGWS